MSKERTYVLSVAGFDPSGGAGLLADVKTMEANKISCLGVLSANTFQNDSEFKGVDWVSPDKIIEQIEILQKRFAFEYVKIGLIESLESLNKIISHLVSKTPTVKIIWDPILKASAGFEFHTDVNKELLQTVLSKVFLITPNVPEAILLGNEGNAEHNAQKLAKYCHVYLKGGHSENKTGYDRLFTKEGKTISFRPKNKHIHAKHGSGCVLSSALTANLAKGESLQRAGLKAKEYTEKYLSSTKTLMGYHRL